MSTLQKQLDEKIIFHHSQKNIMVQHCLRKLQGKYFPQEIRERQAYGLMGGSFYNESLSVELVLPLFKNARLYGPVRAHMNEIISEHAIPGAVPITERAWVADPLEVKNFLKLLQQRQLELVGTYHMHHLESWQGNEIWELPTKLDEVLGKNTGLFMFIIGMVDLMQPTVRAFYEGCIDQEVRVMTRHDRGVIE